jgi:NAD(P)-dependent dehydrogenase (short-subunit alcohol dehydrogenase family)
MLHGQVALITGAAKGIGRTIAHTFARAGARLGIVDIDTKRLHKVSEELRQMGTEVLIEFGDVSNEYEVGRIVDGVLSRFGCKTNLGGTFLCTNNVLPHMEARRSGHIINLHGGGHGVGACAYVVSKEAIRTFTRFVAEEEREWGICVVAVTPGGAVATEDAPAAVHQQMAGLDSLGNRFVLAAEAGMEMTGQLLTLKGGHLEIRH